MKGIHQRANYGLDTKELQIRTRVAVKYLILSSSEFVLLETLPTFCVGGWEPLLEQLIFQS